MRRRPTRSTRTHTLFPYTTRFRSHHGLKASSMVPSIIEIMTEQAELCPHLSETDLSYRLQLVNAMMFQAIYLADQNEPEVPKFEAKFTSALRMAAEIGRASCRERVCKYV